MAGVKGRSGGRSKTIREHKQKGTFQKCRHGGVRDAEAPPGRPATPEELSGAPLAEWGRMVDRLETSGALSRIEDSVIAQYAQLWDETNELARARERTTASIQILEDNLSTVGPDDLMDLFRELTKMRRLESGYASQTRAGRLAILRYLVEFGLTPASRGRVKLPEKPPEDEFAQFEGLAAVK